MKIEVTGFKPKNLQALIDCLTAVVSGNAMSANKCSRDYAVSVWREKGNIKARCYNERPKKKEQD